MVERMSTPGAHTSTQSPKLENLASAPFLVTAAVVITPAAVPAREGENRHAFLRSLPAASATATPWFARPLTALSIALLRPPPRLMLATLLPVACWAT